MIQEKTLRSHQRRLRTFTNRAREELNALKQVSPTTPMEEAQKKHINGLLSHLTSGAEQTLALIEFFLGDGETVDGNSKYGQAIANLFNLYHLANGMYDNYGSFMLRKMNKSAPTEADVEWAEHRVDAYNIIKHLAGRPKAFTTVGSVLRNSTFDSAADNPDVRASREHMDRALSHGKLADGQFLGNLRPVIENVAGGVKRGTARPIVDWSALTEDQRRQAQFQLRRGVENDPSLGEFLEVAFGMPAGTLVSKAQREQRESSRVENVLNAVRGTRPEAPVNQGMTAPCEPQHERCTDAAVGEVRIDLDSIAERVADDLTDNECRANGLGLDALIERAIDQFPELKQALKDPDGQYGISLVVSRR